jgi:hypothetical protein
MKSILLFCCLIFGSVVFAQDKPDFDKKLYVFNSYEDFVNDKPTYVGEYAGRKWDSWFGTTLYYKDESGKEHKYKPSDVWGFKIDDYFFRSFDLKNPVQILKKNIKIFYINAGVMLQRIYFDSPEMETQIEGEAFFFSDDLNSKIFEIGKLKSKAQDVPELEALINCLKRANKRANAQGRLNSTTECILNN